MILLILFILIFSCASPKEDFANEKYIQSSLDSLEKKSKKKIGPVVKKSTQFKDKSKHYGLDGIKAYNFNVVDFNSDGYSDLIIIPSFFSLPEFYKFNPESNKFEKIKSLIDQNDRVSFMLVYDLNHDGVLDLITGVLNQDSELSKKSVLVYHGYKKDNQLRFSVKSDLKITTPVSTIGLIDVNLDGELDIFVGNWLNSYKQTKLPVHDRLFVFEKNEYKERTELLTNETKQNLDKTMFISATPTYAAQVCDVDQNGHPDIITTSTNRFHNKLWMNRYKFRENQRYFDNVALLSGVAADSDGLIHERGGGRTFAVACADYNNDQIMDIFLGELTHNYDDESVDKSSLLTGRTLKYPPMFFRTEYFLDSFDPDWHQADRRAIWSDFDNDGLLDLLVDNSGYPPYSKLILFKQDPDHSFVNISKEYGVDIINPIASVLIDINKDGKMDILTAQTNIRDENIQNRIFLFENQIKTSNKNLKFFTRGQTSNFHGLNASIKLTVKNSLNKIEHRTQQVNYSYGSLPSQNAEGINFGLKQGDIPLQVTVVWPYANSNSASRVSMEKTYKLGNLPENQTDFILCETGKILIYTPKFEAQSCLIKK